MSGLETQSVITRETIKRLAKDVSNIVKKPLTDNGIYYVHDETNMLRGKACIVGPQNTPYEGGYYFFDFFFPHDYPNNPPKVLYYTNDGNTRFNPNLYKNGKVCLSVLNTWRGPQWTGCQSISSILLCICGVVLTDNPLINEPGITEKHRDFETYNKIITYKNYEVAIIDMLTRKDIEQLFKPLMEDIIKHFKNNYSQILKNLEKVACKDITLKTTIYNISANVKYDVVKEKLNKLYLSL
jgi:ubiquitin-conjugating enzyme E2 Z